MAVSKSIRNEGRGGIITRWELFTPVPGSMTNVTTREGAWRRVGQDLQMNVSYTFGGVGGAVEDWINLPFSLNISSVLAAIVNPIARTKMVGQAWHQTSSNWAQGVANLAAGTTQIGLMLDGGTAQTAMSAMSNGEAVVFNISVPVEGW